MSMVVAVVAFLLLPVALPAGEGDAHMDLFVGYTYTWFNRPANLPSFGANGGTSQFVYRYRSWIGGVADVGGLHTSHIGNSTVDLTAANFLFGPRVYTRNKTPATPYLQMLLGGIRLMSSSRIHGEPAAQPAAGGLDLIPPPGQPVTARIGNAETGFAFALGGGVDIRFHKSFSFRPIGIDWFMTRLPNLGTPAAKTQNNLRYTSGFTYTFGAQ